MPINTRVPIGRQDLGLYNGKTSTFQRPSNTGGIDTVSSIGDAVDVLTLFGGGFNRTSAAIQDAISAVGSSPDVAFSFAPGAWTISENITFPSNIVLIPAVGAEFVISSGITMTVDTPEKIIAAPREQIVSGSGTLAFTSPGTVYVGWWGTDATGIGDAIDAANGGQLAWPVGSYSIATAISKTLTAEQEWVVEGPVTCTWAGAANGTMISLELAGFDLTIKGPFVFDGNNSANYPIYIDNSSATMAAAVNLVMTDVKGINAYTTTATDNAGIYIEGGYNRIVLERCSATDCSRAAALAAVTTGIIIKHTDANAYPRQVTVTDVDINTVTSLDDPPIADMDGLTVTGPNASVPGAKYDTVLMTRGGRWTNCQGRSIKSQMESNIIDSPTFVRDSAGEITIAAGREIDFQLGSGILKNLTCHYVPLADTSTPWGATFAVVNASINTHSPEEGVLIVNGGQVINDVPNGTDVLPLFTVLTTSGGNGFLSASISNITMLGEGRIDKFVKLGTSVCFSLKVYDNYFFDMSGGSLINDPTGRENCDAYIANNINKTGTATLLDADAANVPTMTGFGNFGFTEDYTSDASSTSAGETFRVARIMPKNEDEGGGIVTESSGERLDDEVFEFSQRNFTTGIGLYFISASKDDKTQGIFACDTNTQTDLTGGASSDIAFGNAANPDTDGKLNVWVDSNKINVKNRLGGTYVISLMSFG